MKRYGAIILMGVALCGVFSRTSLHLNASRSLPERAFLVVHDLPPQKGDAVLIENLIVHGKTYPSVIKRLVGLPGDRIEVSEGVVTVGGTSIGNCLSETRTGEDLTPIESGVIPGDFVFVAAAHTRSFDSRYQEFGLVPARHLRGRAIGLF